LPNFLREALKAKEWEILGALGFNVSFPTTLLFLERLLYKNFQDDASDGFKEIKQYSVHILKMCLFHPPFLDIRPIILALSVLVYAIRSFFCRIAEQKCTSEKILHEISSQENTVVITQRRD
jgi:hypothetical protein